ncbi:MAG: type II/IV secretion system ATPase subunit [Candidatus Woesearchaeota archaeon]
MGEQGSFEESEGKIIGRLVDTYIVEADKVPATVNIWDVQKENIPIYEIRMPKIAEATEALLNDIRDELAKKIPIEIDDITDTREIDELKQKFFNEAKKIISEHLGIATIATNNEEKQASKEKQDNKGKQDINNKDQKKGNEKDDQKVNIISGIMLHRMFGLGFFDVVMADNWLEELAVNGASNPISVYHKKHGWCKTSVRLKNEEEIFNLSSMIGRKVGREINSLNPIMDAHLLSGDRVASTLFPISTAGNTITIRRFARNPWTIIHFISPEYKTMSLEMAALLWMAMHYELNVMVAGGTASGKTSILSAISGLIPPNQRVISIEDTREITLPEPLHWNWVPLTTRQKNPEGQGEVKMLDLMISSLRMRPDRIIVGEVRRKAQAETMFEAMHTGHSVYTTMHADTAEQVKRRLLEPPIQIPKEEAESLHLIMVQYRDRRKGVRRTLEIAEVLSGGKEDLDINYLYRWLPRNDKFEKANESMRIFENLNMHTGMTPKEINDDLRERESILQWMLDNDIKDIDEVGKIMSIYYKNKELLLNYVRGKKKPDSSLNFEERQENAE